MTIEQEAEKVFVGSLTHDGRMDLSMYSTMLSKSSVKYDTLNMVAQSSLLTRNCNELWCAALNKREQYKLKWFALLHSDVRPETCWLDKMIDLANKHEADLLSVALPIKNEEGICSTAISHPFDTLQTAGRITQKQLKKLPKTFDINDVHATLSEDLPVRGDFLLANTGCMIVRLDKPWSERLYFTINDTIVLDEEGKWSMKVEPEDWFFTRLVAQYGGRVMVTTEVQAHHVGPMAYNNQGVWGKDVDNLMK